MKSIMRITISLFALLLFVLPCYSQETNDALGWQEARWGMSEKELQDTFKSDLKKLDKRQTYFDGENYADYKIPDYEIEGRKYSVFFLMGKESAKLERVVVTLEKASDEKKLFDELESLLTLKYGEVSYMNNDVDSNIISFERQWILPTTTVRLGYLTSPYVTSLTIQYFPTKPKKSRDLRKV